MRDVVAAHFANPPAPQAPARNPPPSAASPHTSTLETYNSHRKVRRPKLAERKIYRPVRRHTLSRIDETPPASPRTRSKSLQLSTEFSSTRPMMRSRSNVSADTSRSVPVCNQSHEIQNQLEPESPQYADPRYDSGSSYEERPASMTDLPIAVPLDPATGAYIPYPQYAYYDDCRLSRFKWKCKKKQPNNLFLAFMY